MRAGRHKRLSNWIVGLIVVALIAVGSAWAFTKQLPWSDAYSVQAIFPSAQNLRTGSPVRIAGVDVGTVTQVEHLSPEARESVTRLDQPEEGAVASAGEALADPAASIVTMEIEESARPIKTDATFRLLPRLFLEGNLFVDIKPGSPTAPEAEEDYVFPVDQASNSVQLDQVLTTLQSDVREQLQITLEEFGSALVDHGGAEGFQELYRSSPGANKFTSQVNEAFLGQNPHDLSGLIRNLDRVLRGLGRNERALQELITNFRIFAGSFAAEDRALERAVFELPRVMDAADPAFAALNRSFPPLRAFAREALPGTRTTPEALDAATPLLRQVRLLVSERELRGLVGDLRPAVPQLARLAARSPALLEQARALSSCFNEVTIPWGNFTVPDPDLPAAGPIYKEASWTLTGLTGESRSNDANGDLFRVQQGGGSNTVQIGGQTGLTDLPIEGVQPPIDSAAKTPFVLSDGRETADIPCETQEPPDLRTGGPGAPPTQFEANVDLDSPLGRLARRKSEYAIDLLSADLLKAQGEETEARELERDAMKREKAFERSGQPKLERLLGVLGREGER
jgi:phospholipid/cholesterol/gamma-HCH transport system substrate-binding protein